MFALFGIRKPKSTKNNKMRNKKIYIKNGKWRKKKCFKYSLEREQ